MRDPRAGQSIIEVLVATAVGSIMIVAAVGLMSPALRTNTDVSRIQTGAALARETIDQMRVWAEADWHNLSRLSLTSANPYNLIPGSPFQVTTGTESVLITPRAGLVGYWKFDESSGTKVNEFSGVNATGSVGATILRGTSTFGMALDFPGSGSPSFSVPDNSLYDFGTNSFSVSVWGYYEDFTYPKANFMVKKANVCYQAGNPGWHIAGYASSGVYVCYTDGANGVGDFAQTFDSGYRPSQLMNRWNHLVVVFDKSVNRVKFYMNGRKQSAERDISAVTGSVDNASALTMGTLYGWQTDGRMDELRIYNRALTEEEVQAIYSAPSYIRSFHLDSVNRDGSGNIAASGDLDPSTLKITVNYGWPGGPTNTMVSYLTRAVNRIYQQSDWFGGAGVDGPSTTTNNRYSTSSNVTGTSTAGSIQIPLQ